MKKTLKVGIAPRDIIARYSRDVVAGRRRRTADDPDIWFTSVESFAIEQRDRAFRCVSSPTGDLLRSMRSRRRAAGRKAISRALSIPWRAMAWCG